VAQVVQGPGRRHGVCNLSSNSSVG
jgi:hypothetical protein